MSDLHEYKCPACGGALAFDSGLQKMKCPYCDSVYELSSLQNVDNELNTAQQAQAQDNMEWNSSNSTWSDEEADGMRVYVCKSCGGEIVGDANTAATSCPYCGNPIVMMGQFKGDLKPDYVIPFKLNKDQAMARYNQHLSGKKFLPKVFKDQNRIKEIQGVYVPFWLFDAQAQGTASYKTTTSRTWQDSQYSYKETSYYNVQRGGRVTFNKVPVDGSKKMDDTLMQSLEPFNFNDAVPFQTAYLAGYVADKYDVTKEETIQIANERIKNTTHQYLDSTVQGSESCEPTARNTRVFGGTASYALYPVWMLSTQYNNQKYTFAMNGQTGKFVGDLPIDEGAVKGTMGLAGGITAAVVLALAWLLAGQFPIWGLVIGLGLGVLAAFLAKNSVKASLVSVHQETRANNYVVNQGLELQRDVFANAKTDRIPLAQVNQQNGRTAAAAGGVVAGAAVAGGAVAAHQQNGQGLQVRQGQGNMVQGNARQAASGVRVQNGVSNLQNNGNVSQAGMINTNRPVNNQRPMVNNTRPVNTASAARTSTTASRPAVNTSRPAVSNTRPVTSSRTSVSSSRPSSSVRTSSSRPSVSSSRPSVSSSRPSSSSRSSSSVSRSSSSASRPSSRPSGGVGRK